MKRVEEDTMVDDGLVEKLHAQLAEALRRSRPQPFESPVTVAEIYQDLVPYRSVRSALGFQMNADYEHTLLRLLAGVGGLARLEPEEAREELSAELETPNPNVGLFRKFAACDVWITPSDEPLPTIAPVQTPPAPTPRQPASPTSRFEPPSSYGFEPPARAFEPPATPPAAPPRPASTPAATPAPPRPAARQAEPPAPPPAPPLTPAVPVEQGWSDAAWSEPQPQGDEEWDALAPELLLEEEVDVPDTSGDTETAGVAGISDQPEPATMFESRSSHAVAEAAPAGACAFCRNSLPKNRKARFCPHCGADQAMKPCPTCREALDPAWKFCIGCGAEQG